MRQRWKKPASAAAIAIACVGIAVAVSRAQQQQHRPPPAVVTTQPTTTRTLGLSSGQLEAARAMSRDMRAQVAAMAGYPQIGQRVEVGLKQASYFGVPTSFDALEPGTSNNFHLTGKLAAFDAHWVGLEADDGAQVWLPRENVSHVYSPPPRGSAAATRPRPR